MERMTLCGANSAVQKYYFNNEFDMLPETVREELRRLCVLFTAEVGGIIYLEFDEDGNLLIQITHGDDDFLFDEIGAGLKAGELRREKRELFEQLELFYQMIMLPKMTARDTSANGE